ncbi:uncharacterized protein B0I36DRAFT_140146 [Microdochium trichocladiopsis]|uniref:AAA+ ATPase domain-containing protein n=1 Tax=Microdochium trichocladiopsis TaxID=1682393 RepID=A0A9P8Y289_9PEZI|nr:uncharacterized protein B0I36DRAFT_140146 [Microdochium trichocladiopsis]KAH7027558.1 hypothetical protein B0I36DRAFT_140146 [Microdochium trichocladiopsis]
MGRKVLSAEKANELLFRKLLNALRDTDLLHRGASCFVVYAHDSAANPHDNVPAHAETTRWIIERLRLLCPSTLSDRNPVPPFESRADDYDSCHDIVANQACLIPGLKRTSDGGKVGTVDKAIICVSPRLCKYLETRFAKRYMESIRQAYRQHRSRPRNEVVAIIRNLVEQSHKHPDFHHVLTEFGLLTLDKDIVKDVPRTILLTLNSATLDLPMFPNTSLQILSPRREPSTHKAFFKLLKRVHENHDSIIKLYAEAYSRNKVTQNVTESTFRARIAGVINQIHEETQRLSVQRARNSLARDRNSLKQAESSKVGKIPETSSIIPFSRDRDFIQRGDLLDRIHISCAEPGSSTALVGPAGVGKSQLAIQYAHEVREKFPNTWVFWIHASNAARYEQGFRQVAGLVELPGRQDPNGNIFELVHNWLRGGTGRRWRLILDNVDDPSFLFGIPGKAGDTRNPSQLKTRRLLDYLPNCENGSILVTSRSKRAVEDLVEPANIVQIDPMGGSEAISLIETKLGTKNDKKSIEALAAALEYMPLAIIQATAYIANRAPLCSVQQYLEKFAQSDRKRASLLERDVRGRRFRRDPENKNSIIITWQISFKQIQQIRPSAAELLSLMSFFDRQGIPQDILWPLNQENGMTHYLHQARQEVILGDSSSDEDGDTNEWDTEGLNSNASEDVDKFEDDIALLHDFSLLSTNDDGKTFEMHSLVQLATQRWLEDEGHQQQWRSEFVERLNAKLPNGNYENWATWRILLPHAVAASTQQPAERSSLIIWTEILYKMAWYLTKIGRHREAQKMAQTSVDHRLKMLGRQHRLCRNALNLCATTNWSNGHWEAAEKLFLEILEFEKQNLGPDHPDMLGSMENLASTYGTQGRLKEAEELQIAVLETRKQKLGPDHPNTLHSMANLASTYSHQGRYKEAEELEVAVLKMRTRKLGLDHPSTLLSMANLASTYSDQGRYKEAEKLEVAVLEMRKQKLGPDHPNTLHSMANLASTYSDQGRYKEAEEPQLAVLEMRKQKLGLDHPDTLHSMGHLASTYYTQG